MLADPNLHTWFGSAWLNGELVWFAHCTSCHQFSTPYVRKGDASQVARYHDCARACVHCRFRQPHGSGKHGSYRGLCRPCYNDEEIRMDYERSTRLSEDVLEDYDLLRREGFTVRQAADRLGMTHAALDKALCRAKQRGDPRAVRNTPAPYTRSRVGR